MRVMSKGIIIHVFFQTDVSVPIYTSAVILFLIVSISAIFISFFGCCGAYKESKCMLATVRNMME